jgi:hypothetical protein
MIPTSPHGLWAGHGMIEEQAANDFLKAGATTRAEVLLRYGEPEEIVDEGRGFVYAWTRITGMWAYAIVVPSPSPGGSAWGTWGTGGYGYFTATTLLLLEFDSGNRLTRYAFEPRETPLYAPYGSVRRGATDWLKAKKKDSP